MRVEIGCKAATRPRPASRALPTAGASSSTPNKVYFGVGNVGDERIAECITQQRAQDATLEAYRPGEFTRARRGQHVEMPQGIVAPPLAPEED